MAQAFDQASCCCELGVFVRHCQMLPKTNKPMKATTKATARAMTKGNIAKALAGSLELKQKVCSTLLNSLAEVATKEVKNGVFAIPGLCRLKTRTKPATK